MLNCKSFTETIVKAFDLKRNYISMVFKHIIF